MKLSRTVLLVMALAALTVAAGNFGLPTVIESAAAVPGISFSLRILGQELVGFTFLDSRSTTTAWINEHEEK